MAGYIKAVSILNVGSVESHFIRDLSIPEFIAEFIPI